MKKHDISKRIAFRAQQALEKLLKRGNNARDYSQARRFAAAAVSWCRMHPATGSSKRRGGACEQLWKTVIAQCDAVLTKPA